MRINVNVVLVALVSSILAGRAASAASERTGVTLHVSKRGDSSDGSSWAKAFHTIQQALDAVPDDRGGHRIEIRPDTYAEANLHPARKGAAGSYNVLVGDVDGKLGSGATGRVVIDSGDPARGFKSYDWWGPIRAYSKGWSKEHTGETTSSLDWDRWTLRNLYVTGGDGGLFFDLTDKTGNPFSVVVEDCVTIGRAFGGGVAGSCCRPGEPVIFRRSYLMCLDWWGDAAGGYIRAHNAARPTEPDVVFDDCTLVGPDNAVQIGYPTFTDIYTRVQFRNCRMIVLNFSQPVGTPSSGIICCDIPGAHCDLALEDCSLMGYKVFGISPTNGTRKDPIRYTTKGRVRAYVQYQQDVPQGIERLTQWPVELFDALAPPTCQASKPERRLVKQPGSLGRDVMESSPLWYRGRLLLFHSHRVDTPRSDLNAMYLFLKDPATGRELSRFGQRHSLGSALVAGERVHVFAAEHSGNDWFHDIFHFWSDDLVHWNREPAIQRTGGEHLLNSSVCRDDSGYLMTYESDRPVSFCFKFARSRDLVTWDKVPGLTFRGTGKEYSACPVIRYIKPYYYVIYLHAAIPGHNGWISFLARSRDLAAWELSPKNPILEAGAREGRNNSDVDLIDIDGKTHVYYSTGDQQTWGELKEAIYPGSMAEFFESCFPEGRQPDRVNAR